MLILMGFVRAAAVDAQQVAGDESLVFDGVTVVDVERGQLVPDQRVVIAGNRIRTVANGRALSFPKGARVVDARGKYLIPGLWDMHVHPGASVDFFYPLLLANGVTGYRNAYSEVPLKTQIQWWHEILAGTRVGPPRQLLAGLSFGQHYPDTDRAVVEHLIDSLKADGANFLKVYPYSAIVAVAARRAGLPFGGHMIYIDYMGGYKEAPETPIEASDSGMRIFDHQVESKLSGICLGRTATIEKCGPVVERFQQNGSWVVPTLMHSIGGSKYSPVARAALAARTRRFWSGDPLHGNWLRDSVHGGPPGLTDLPPDSLGFLRIAERAGLPLLVGTDEGGSKDAPAGFLLQAELAAYVAEGLTPLEALRTATINPAKLLAGTDSLGTVAPGKLADLVLLDADPLMDITNTTAIRAVVANGRYFDRAALDSLFAQARASAEHDQTP